MAISFPKKLKELRESAKLSQEALGEAASCSRQTIYNYESGLREPEVQILVNIAQVFGVSVDTLVGLSGADKLTLEIMSNNFKTLHSAFVVIQNQLNQLAGAAVHPDVVTFFAALDPNQQVRLLEMTKKTHSASQGASTRSASASKRR